MKRYRSLKEWRVISVGTIIHDTSSILLGHITHSKHWDIFKGVAKDDLEPLIDTAQRELYEESGLKIDKSKFNKLGYFPYVVYKDLFLYDVLVDFNTINVNSLKCSSYFEYKGKQYKEIDGYKIVPISDLYKYISPNLFKVLSQVFLNKTTITPLYESYISY